MTATTPAAENIVFLLRHLGPQSERELQDSLSLTDAELRAALDHLVSIHRIERHGPNRWRLIPKATP